jgi:hypothetical protein
VLVVVAAFFVQIRTKASIYEHLRRSTQKAFSFIINILPCGLQIAIQHGTRLFLTT